MRCQIDERKNKHVSRCFMHPLQQESDRAVVYAVVGETHKYSPACTVDIRASVRPRVPCWQGDFEFS